MTTFACINFLNTHRLSVVRGGKMNNYRQDIIELLEQVEDEKFLRYLYLLIMEMIAKSR